MLVNVELTLERKWDGIKTGEHILEVTEALNCTINKIHTSPLTNTVRINFYLPNKTLLQLDESMKILIGLGWRVIYQETTVINTNENKGFFGWLTSLNKSK